MDIFKSGVCQPQSQLLLTMRALTMLLAKPSVTPILFADKEGYVHGQHMRFTIQPVLPQHCRTVPFLSEKGITHLFFQLMSG